MKNTTFIILFFLILLIGSSIFVFILKPQRDRLISGDISPTIEINLEEQNTNLITDFNETGNIVNTDPLISSEGPDFSLLYEMPGSPAVKVDLIFSKNSQCNVGYGLQPCSQVVLHVGDRVSVKGLNNEERVDVVELVKTS